MMKIKPRTPHNSPISALAFTLPEVIVGVAIMGVLFISLYGGLASAFGLTQLARENLRGTQIMLERMEGIRLFNWNQLTASNMIPVNFTNYYYPLASNGQPKGIVYYGTMTISTNVVMNPTVTYGGQMALVTATITWTNSNVQRTRTMSTYVAKNGIQNYVYSN